MGQILLGLIIAIAGVVYALYMYRKSKNDLIEIQYMQTTPISEALELLQSMDGAGSTYRHYVELKGILHSKEPVSAPFTERQVAYYHSSSYSVHEETRTECDSKGNTRTRTVKKENLISDEKSPVPVYITD